MSAAVESMAFVGQIPWHGLGTKVDANSPEAYDAEAFMRLAGLDWNVRVQDVYSFPPGMVLAGQKVEPVKLDGFHAVVRERDQRVFTVRTESYCPFQYRDAFKMFDAACEAGLLRYETAGALHDGAVAFIVATMGEMAVKGDKSPVRKYVCLASSHDGTRNVSAAPVATRVVCANTLRLSESEKGGRLTFKHTAGVADRVCEAGDALANAIKAYERFGEKANWMADQRFGDRLFESLGDAVVRSRMAKPVLGMEGVTEVNGEIVDQRPLTTQGQKALEDMTGIFQAGEYQRELAGTAWGALQAVTQHANFGLSYRDSGHGRLNNQVASVLMGQSAQIIAFAERHIDAALKGQALVAA